VLQLPRKTLHAVEAVLDVACHARPAPVSSGDIARRQGIPKRYLEPVMQRLVRAGVLKGQRGPKGGYRLARERRRISIGEIVRVFVADEAEVRPDASRSALGRRVVAPLWRDFETDLLSRLDAVTIEDLCGRADAAGIAALRPKRADLPA
jgi:Rrf2 family protein